MSVTVIIFIILFAFAATFIQRVTGFGFGIVFMTAAPFLMPSYGEATALSGMLALMCAIVTGARFFKYIPWKKLVVLMITFLIVSFFSVKAVSYVDGRTLKHALGAVLICVSIYFFLFNGKIRMKPTVPVQVSMGTISGITGGLFGIQGPPAVIYFISCTNRKDEYMAITQAFFIIGNTMMTLYRAGSGFVTPVVIKGWLIGVGAVFFGLLLGAKVYSRIPIGTLRKFVYVFIGISGVVALMA